MAQQELTFWQRWREHPEQVWMRHAMFQIHFWVGAAVDAYILLMSVSGSLLVFRGQYAARFPVQWLLIFTPACSQEQPGAASMAWERSRCSCSASREP